MVIKKSKVRSNKSSIKSKKIFETKIHSVTSVVAFIILVVLLSSLITLLLFKFFHQPEPSSVEKLPYDFTVVNDVSFVLDTDALHFGGGPQGARLERGMNISVSQDSLVKISWDGPGNLIVSKNNFLLKAGKTEDLLFYLDIPSDLSLGNYSGEVIFKFYR